MIALTIALAVLVGISLGLLGGGGSILTVPLLAYVAGMEPKHAIATSLLVVGVTSAIARDLARPGRPGPVAHRGCSSAWRPWPAPTPAAWLARFIPGTVLLVGVRRDHDRRRAGDAARPQGLDRRRRDQPLPVVRIALLGMAVGADQRARRRRRRLPGGARTGAAGRTADARRGRHLAGRHRDAIRSPASPDTSPASRSTGAWRPSSPPPRSSAP